MQPKQPSSLEEYSKGFKMRVEEEEGTAAHIKPVSFFFPPLSLSLSLSLTITAALEAELLNCSKMSELQSSLQ